MIFVKLPEKFENSEHQSERIEGIIEEALIRNGIEGEIYSSITLNKALIDKEKIADSLSKKK